MKPAEIEALTNACAERLRARGMRRTRALDLLIREMAGREKPVTIAELAQRKPDFTWLDVLALVEARPEIAAINAPKA